MKDEIGRIAIIIIIITIGLYARETGLSEEQIRNNINQKGIHEDIMNVTKQIQYKNLYEEEPTIGAAVNNILNTVLYSIAITVNTLIPTVIWASGQTSIIIKLAILYIIVKLFFIIQEIIKLGIYIYFFIKEKKESKTRFYQ